MNSRSVVAGLSVGFALLLAANLTHLPVAAADEGMYLDEVRQKVEAPLTDAQAFALGRIACDAIRAAVNSGLSFGSARANADEAVGWAQKSMGLSLSMPDGMFLVEAAENQLC